jgi:hypothetical protein
MPLSADAAAEWNRIVESVLRGVAHSLNNRAAALAAVAELIADPADRPEALREILATEQDRVRDLVRALQTIGAGGSEAEALMPADVAADVAVVMQHHPDLREGVVEIDASQGAPVRATRWMFARVVLVLAAGLAGGPRWQPRRLAMRTVDDWLSIAAEHPAPTPRLASELARHFDGEPLPDRYGIRVPTLAAVRRRGDR